MIILFSLSVLLYANTFNHDYTQDDAIVIHDNMLTQKGFSGIKEIFKYDTFYGFFKTEGKSNLVSGGRYRPLTLVSFAIEYQFFGSNPKSGHIFNILFFGFLAMLLYSTLKIFFESNKKISEPLLIAFFSTVLFILHPIHTEAVANIKGRDEIFAMIGAISALYFLLKWLKNDQFKNLIFAFGCFFLGLLSKENTITFLAIIPAAFWMLSAKTKKILISTVPLIFATILFISIRVSVLGPPQKDSAPMELMNNPFIKIENNTYIRYSQSEKLASISYSLGKYFQLMFFPHPLTHDYYPAKINVTSFGNPWAILSLILYVSLALASLLLLMKRKLSGFYIFYYLATISIFSNIVFPIGTHLAERFLFMPSLAFAMAGGHLFIQGIKNKPKYHRLYVSLLTIIIVLFSAKTTSRNLIWKDNYKLFTTDINTSSNSAKLNNAVGGELYVQSLKDENEGERTAMLEKALKHLNKAINIHPNYKNAHLLKGNCLFQLKSYDNSIASYNNALKLDPNYQDAYNNIGIAYRDAGRYYGEQEGDLQKSISYLEKAHEIRGDEYETLRLLGVAYGIARDNEKAIYYFQKTVDAFPDNADAAFNLGIAFFNAGNIDQGNKWRQKAIELNPDVVKKYN